MQANKRNAPAYSGARFDINGFCIAHSDVRLCKVTDNGQYKIVCKTCFKCGSSALETDAHNQRTNVHGYRKKTSAPREVPSQLLTASGKNKCDTSLSHGHDGNHGSRAKSAPLLSRRRSIAASSNEDVTTRGRMMGVSHSTSRSKSFGRKSSHPKLIKESVAKPKMDGQHFDARTVDGSSKSCRLSSAIEGSNNKQDGQHFHSTSSPRLSMESPKTRKVVHQFESIRTVDGLKQNMLALTSDSGEKHENSVLAKVKAGPLTRTKASPLTRTHRHQVDNKTIEGLKQSSLALSNSPGVKNEVSVYVKESPRTKGDWHQLDNRTVETLKQSFKTMTNSPVEKGGPGSWNEKEMPDNSSTRKRVDQMLFREGPSNHSNGHLNESATRNDGRTQNNSIALPNSTARLARRPSMTRSFGNP